MDSLESASRDLIRATTTAQRIAALSALAQALAEHGSRDEALVASADALDLARDLGDPLAMALAWHARGFLLVALRRPEAAMAAFERAVPGLAEARHPAVALDALECLHLLQRAAGRMEEAVATLQQAVGVARRAGLPAREGRCLVELAGLRAEEGDAATALLLYADALPLLKDADDLGAIAEVHCSLLRLYLDAGLLELARATLSSALDLCTSVGEAGSVARLCLHWAAHRISQAPAEAAEWLLKALLPARLASEPRLLSDVLTLLADARHRTGDAAGALAACGEALDAAQAADARANVPRILFFRGLAQAALGEPAPAADALRTALRGFRSIGDEEGVTAASVTLADVLVSCGEGEAALHLMQRTLARIGEPALRRPLLQAVGSCQALLGRHGDALRSYRRLLVRARKERAPDDEARALYEIGRMLGRMGRPVEAASSLAAAVDAARGCGQGEIEGDALLAMALLHRQAGRREDALEACESALRAHRGRSADEAEALTLASELRLEMGDLDGALERLEASLPLRRGSVEDEARARSRCAVLCVDIALRLPPARKVRRDDLLRRALAHCEDGMRWLHDDASALCDLHAALSGVHFAEGRIRQAKETLRDALARCPHAAARAALLVRLGHVQLMAGQTRASVETFKLASELWRAGGDELQAALALLEAGAANVGESPQDALLTLERAVRDLRALQEPALLAAALLRQGEALQDVDAPVLARACFEEALTLLPREAPDAARALTKLAVLVSDQAPTQALLYLREALPIARAAADRSLETSILVFTGFSHARLGNRMEAVENYSQALALTRVMGDDHMEGVALDALNRMYFW